MAAPATGEPDPATAGAETPRRRVRLFGRDSRIRDRPRFEALYARPTRRAGRLFVAYWDRAPADAAGHRLGVTAAKRTFHDAHERNRAKRLLRESFRLLRPAFAGGPWDLVLVARRPILRAQEPDVRAELASVCLAAGILPTARVEGLPAPPASQGPKVETATVGPSGPSRPSDPRPPRG